MFWPDKEFLKEAGGIFVWVFILMGLVAGGILGVISFANWISDTPENRKAAAQARIPKIYSKVDGCTVYIWNNDGRNHYFTKCDNTNKVITENSWTENCGKACSKTVVEKIETN